MARPKSTATPDLSTPVDLTVGVIERLVCPEDKQQAFLRDAKTPGLKVRVTRAGAKSFVFERKIGEKTMRPTIGSVSAWTIDQARAEARRLSVAMDNGEVPQPARAAARDAASVDLLVKDVWAAYLDDRKQHWGIRHCEDHERLAAPGGEKRQRGPKGKSTTVPGVLHPLMSLRMLEVNEDTIEAWASKEAAARATQARLGARLFRAFLNWCSEQKEYRAFAPTGAGVAKTRRTKDTLGKNKAKSDALLREQLPAWFKAVIAMKNPVVSAYLQTCLLTGARPGEVIGIEHGDIDWRWRTIRVRDKIEGERVIPLPRYVAYLLVSLPRRTKSGGPAYVFNTPLGGRIGIPHKAHFKACTEAGIKPVSRNGLRRSFRSLSEWVECPAGVVAQIMGHKPSATAEKHYTVRPLDLLRMHHERIERWMLSSGSVDFDYDSPPVSPGTV